MGVAVERLAFTEKVFVGNEYRIALFEQFLLSSIDRSTVNHGNSPQIINAVINHLTAIDPAKEFQHERVVGPDQRLGPLSRTEESLQGPANQSRIKPPEPSFAMSAGDGQWRKDPNILLRLPWPESQRSKASPQSPPQSFPVFATAHLRAAQPDTLHITHSPPESGKSLGRMLLVGPVRLVPIGRGEKDDITRRHFLRRVRHGRMLPRGPAAKRQFVPTRGHHHRG